MNRFSRNGMSVLLLCSVRQPTITESLSAIRSRLFNKYLIDGRWDTVLLAEKDFSVVCAPRLRSDRPKSQIVNAPAQSRKWMWRKLYEFSFRVTQILQVDIAFKFLMFISRWIRFWNANIAPFTKLSRNWRSCTILGRTKIWIVNSGLRIQFSRSMRMSWS